MKRPQPSTLGRHYAQGMAVPWQYAVLRSQVTMSAGGPAREIKVEPPDALPASDSSPDSLDEYMQALGAEGWELVSSISEELSFSHYFKKPVE